MQPDIPQDQPPITVPEEERGKTSRPPYKTLVPGINEADPAPKPHHSFDAPTQRSAPDPQTHARVVVLEQVYYQAPNEQPLNRESKFSKFLQTIEQPFLRKITLSNKWSRLDAGWLRECSLLTIANEEGKFYDRNPTKEEKAAAALKVVEVLFQQPINLKHRTMEDPPLPQPLPQFIIPPQESCRLTPITLTDIYLRCQHLEGARITIMVYPK